MFFTDNGVEAFEQHCQHGDDLYDNCGDATAGESYEVNSLYYHKELTGVRFIGETEKALKVSVKGVSVDFWCPKAVCKRINKNKGEMYILKAFYSKKIAEAKTKLAKNGRLT